MARVFKGIVLMLSFFLFFSILSCSNGIKQGKDVIVKPDEKNSVVQPGNPAQINNDRNTSTADNEEKDRILKSLLDERPFGEYEASMFYIFTDVGIVSYYSLYKHVPDSYESYISSGIPLLIPNDYVSGRAYHPVDIIDINDTSGFKFTSDGIDTCSFEFVVRNRHTDQNEIYPIKYDSFKFQDYKDGIFSNNVMYFDKAKREFCLMFFTYYGFMYLDKYGTAPENLVDMLKNEGTPIEAGWKWNPEPGEYFEYGIDTSKLRSYHIQSSRKSRPGKASVVVQQMHKEVLFNHEPQIGVDEWSFSSRDSVPPDVVELNKFISSDSFYEGYLLLNAN